jgi:uncharacterized protein
MLDTKALSPEALRQITNSLNIPMHSLVAVIGLLDEGGTVPFIARYRKEATGNLDEVQIRAIEEKLAYLRDLLSRRATILASVQEQGKRTACRLSLESAAHLPAAAPVRCQLR